MSLAARGEGYGAEIVERGFRYSTNGVLRLSGTTRWFGRNLRASAFGVLSVWMKILRLPPTAKFGKRRCRGRIGREEALM
jgi:hypothetical protein